VKKLNDKIWGDDNKIIPIVKSKLLILSKKITDEISNFAKVKHIYFTGSLATYHWTPVSDIDLHIIVDILNECEDSITEYLDLLCKLFNKEHNIYIKGYKVEVNIKSEENILKNKAIYDLLKDEWVSSPNQPLRDTSDEQVVKTSKHYQNIIDDIINKKENVEYAKKLKKELKELRKKGLESEDGEYSIENLVFKSLRNSGYISKLFNYYNSMEDNNLSLEKFNFKNFYKL
jgi:hypothetical protein